MTEELCFEEARPDSPEARWCLEQYYQELKERFEGGFDSALSAVSDPADFERPGGVFLIATSEGRAVGCGAVKLTAKHVGYIKRMWIEPAHRGRGLGRRMLVALEDAAADLGCRVVQLETNRSLTGAIELYRTAGYREVPPFNDEYYADFWFEKTLGAK